VPAWDQFICVRHGRVECVWSISARNCHQ
jgi:hypothetical protein